MKPRDIEQGPWEDALTEAREAMIATVLSAKGMIAYSDFDNENHCASHGTRLSRAS